MRKQRGTFLVIMAVILLYAALIIAFNLIADLLYGWLDPRSRT